MSKQTTEVEVAQTTQNIEQTEAHAEVSESGSPLASLGINPTLFTFQLVNFAIVGSIIWFLILKPLSKKLTERQKMIDESIANSKQIQENLQKSEQKFQERIDVAKVEANKILDKAQNEAENVSVALKEKAKKEIELLVDQAKRNIRIERDEMVAEIKKSAADMVVSALEKILSEKIDEKKDKHLIEEMVKKLQ